MLKIGMRLVTPPREELFKVIKNVEDLGVKIPYKRENGSNVQAWFVLLLPGRSSVENRYETCYSSQGGAV